MLFGRLWSQATVVSDVLFIVTIKGLQPIVLSNVNTGVTFDWTQMSLNTESTPQLLATYRVIL